ncbi:hypothetical protein QYM36_009287, partial [Artemia franciscana]
MEPGITILQTLATLLPEAVKRRFNILVHYAIPRRERLVQHATENLVIEVLIQPLVSTVRQCVKNLLASFTKHRHIIHVGYTLSGSGDWLLQDGTFSVDDFIDLASDYDVQRIVRAYESSISMDITCSPDGYWMGETLQQNPKTKGLK